MSNYYSNPSEERKIMKLAESKLKGISNLFHGRHVVISEGERKEIFLVSDEIFKAYKLMVSKHPSSMGLFFGEYHNDDIRFSLPAITEYNRISDYHQVVIHRSAEQKFLYGRNLHSEVIVSYDKTLEKGDTVVVCNQKHEPLGVGIVTGDFKSKSRVQVINNLMDIGLYLRGKE
ncbi:MAG: hypothetical protein PHH61_02375 [Candidatus Nanoarchaeia archaeon]|nr:hypothetical protein [Candidatus Nanoarchaeia archaeon]